MKKEPTPFNKQDDFLVKKPLQLRFFKNPIRRWCWLFLGPVVAAGAVRG